MTSCSGTIIIEGVMCMRNELRGVIKQLNKNDLKKWWCIDNMLLEMSICAIIVLAVLFWVDIIVNIIKDKL